MPSEVSTNNEASKDKSQAAPPRSRGLFAIPPPLKRLFDRFPLVTYPANELPLRALRDRSRHALYVFAENGGVDTLSFNPSCLKWQAYLRFCHIDHVLVPSNNHASPSGSLPVLLPAFVSPRTEPITSGKLHKWAMHQCKTVIDESTDMRYEAYMSLLDHSVRRAWLHSLYLTTNFETIVTPLYIDGASNSSLVRASTALSLRAAAKSELARYSPLIDPEAIYSEAETALAALDTLLGNSEWFWDQGSPGLFDASVFAYVGLALDGGLAGGWSDRRLVDCVQGKQGLRRHRDEILQRFWPGK